MTPSTRLGIHVTTFAMILLAALSVSAQVAVTLPDTSQTTLLTASVSEQARVIVPAGVTFAVIDISVATPAPAATVTIDNIVLATATKQLKISLQANAASFTPPVALAATWVPADVTWGAAAWTNGTGAIGTLSDLAFNEVATCDPDVAACDSTALIFTLAPNLAVTRSGSHTLSVTWKFESI